MIVIIAGMQRSGSTFSFNVARELLATRGRVRTVSNNNLGQIELPGVGCHLIIKSHQPDAAMRALIAEGQARCICTLRKPEDAVASWMRVFKFDLDSSIDAIKSWLAWHRELSSCTLNISYEDIDNRPLHAVRRICHFVCKDATAPDIFRIWWKYRKTAVKRRSEELASTDDNVTHLPFSYYDNETFFHRHHVSSLASQPATATLTAEDVATIRDRLADYLDERGNYQMTAAGSCGS